MGPRQRELLDELLVVDDRLLLDRCVDPVVSLSALCVHALEVQATIDLRELTDEVEPAHELLVVEILQLRVVAPDLVIRRAEKCPHVVGRVPDVPEVVR